MFIIKLPLGDMGLQFEHVRKPDIYNTNGDLVREGHFVTTCHVFDLDKVKTKEDMKNPQLLRLLGHGIAICHPWDVFVKEAGRKLALTRALKASKLDRATRFLVWDAYFQRGVNKAGEFTTDPRRRSVTSNQPEAQQETQA